MLVLCLYSEWASFEQQTNTLGYYRPGAYRITLTLPEESEHLAVQACHLCLVVSVNLERDGHH